MAPNKSNKDRSNSPGRGGSSTSSNREESMAESGDDAFASKGAVRNPDQATKRGRGKGGTDEHQSPRESGTTPLGGETPGSDSIRGPGGVEGSGGRE